MAETSIVIVDDHAMVASAIHSMVNEFRQCKVLYEARNGRDLLQRLKNPKLVPDLILLDINMPVMDGYQTMQALHDEYPELLVLCLSMNDDRDSFLKMIESGAHGFISKIASERDLEVAIHQVMDKGCYYTPEMADMLFRSMSEKKNERDEILSDREKQFLAHVPTELTYQQIADEMCLSPKTIDGYRNSLFQKLDIRSRTGLAMYAVREGYYTL